MSVGASSIGTTIQLGEAEGVYILEDCVIDATLPGDVTQFVEDKCLGQETRTVPSIPTWNMPETMTFRQKYHQDNYAQLLDWQADQTYIFGKLTFPPLRTDAGAFQVTPGSATFEGYIQQVTTPFPEDGGRVIHDIVFKRTTPLVYAEGDALT